MLIVDRIVIPAPPSAVFPLAAAVERWPSMLSHYRFVKRLSGDVAGPGVVEMAAWRPFGIFRWPTWWCSDVGTDAVRHRISYRHIDGITTGMDVLWTIDPTPEGWSDVTIVHEWKGPRWPLIGRLVADWIIGPVFVHGIASRTLAGIARAAAASRDSRVART
jgi:ribosome-associated toxin RatA of RatAB toxin-antitoxin module